LKQIPKILAMFVITQFIGLLVGIEMVGSPEFSEFNVAPTQQPGDVTNSFIFIGYVVLGAVVLVLLLKFYKGLLVFRFMEGLIIFVSSNVVFSVILHALKFPLYIELAFFISLALVGAKSLYPKIRNIAAIIASAGVGAIFGFSLDIVPALFLIVGLSAYDFVSVFWTKHMVYMAKELSKKNLSFSVAAKEKRYIKELKREEESSLELGTGDMAIPLMLAVSAYKMSPALGLYYSLATIVGASIGLVFVLVYVTRKRVFLPALPPLTFFALSALALVKFAIG
jgi:presenilin-like A22 family membrane protease